MPIHHRSAVYLLAAVSILAIPSAVQALPIFFRVDSITLQIASSADENAIVTIGASQGIGSLASWVPRASRNGRGPNLSFAQAGHAAAFLSGFSGSLAEIGFRGSFSEIGFRDRLEGLGGNAGNRGNGIGLGNRLNAFDGILANLLGQTGIPALILLNLGPGFLNSPAINPVTLSLADPTTVPPAVPEPATLTLWASAAAVLAFGSKLRARRRTLARGLFTAQ